MTGDQYLKQVREERIAELKWSIRKKQELERRVEELTEILGGVPWMPGMGNNHEAQGR